MNNMILPDLTDYGWKLSMGSWSVTGTLKRTLQLLEIVLVCYSRDAHVLVPIHV